MTHRPALTDRAVLREAAQDFLGALNLQPHDDDAIDAFVDTMAESSFDAHEAAKTLEHQGWEADRELVDTLDDYFQHVHTVQRRAIAAWVAGSAIVAHLSEGDAAKWTDRGRDLHGVVAAVDHQHATYTVRVPALGHVEHGVGTHGLVVPFETFHGLAAPPEHFQLTPPPNAVGPVRQAPHPDDAKRFNRPSGTP